MSLDPTIVARAKAREKELIAMQKKQERTICRTCLRSLRDIDEREEREKAKQCGECHTCKRLKKEKEGYLDLPIKIRQQVRAAFELLGDDFERDNDIEIAEPGVWVA